jgi:asparagine synthase (glutamine-hydrolysing)
MCGIAGFIGEDTARIERMTQCLVHRGPDGNAVWTGAGASLGQARLAILDPRPEGNQPMWNDAKTVVITYNGEIFNYRRLKESEGLTCRTGTDTEVLLKLYEKHGIDFVKKLLGMFAFAIYDTRTKTLHLSRDQSGIKPLYLSYVDGKPHFASEMRSLMSALPKKPAINLRAMSAFIRLQYVPGPETMCEGIESLAPGTILSWKDGKEARRSFAADVTVPTVGSRADFMRDFPSLMQEVVTDHMIADKPIGIFLSGGMDSSIVLHHMAKVSTSPVKTFTVRFEATEAEDAARFNKDAELAHMTAKHYGTDHEELALTATQYKEMYRDTSRALDLPNSDAVSVAQYALSKIAKKKADVVLTGAGGDELFGGYPRYRIAKILSMLQWIPSPLRGLAGTITGYPSDVLRMAPGADLAERLMARPLTETTSIVRGEWFESDAVARKFSEHFSRESGNDVRKFMEVDRHLWLVDESLKLADAVTMGNGLEGRVPFLDPRVIAWSHATPSSWHVGMNRTKALLKDTYRHILPEHLFTLKKASFYPPLAKWIRRECAPLVEEALAGKRINEFFDTKKLRAMFEEHKAKTRYNLHPLANVVQLHHWFETVYDA